MVQPVAHRKWAVALAAFALAAALSVWLLSATGKRRLGAPASRRHAGETPALQAGGTPALPGGETPALQAGGTPALPGGGTPTVPAALPGYRWGGASNSAREDGSGFFEPRVAREFTSAVVPDLRKYVVNLKARAFLPFPGPENLAAVFQGSASRAPGQQAGGTPALPGAGGTPALPSAGGTPAPQAGGASAAPEKHVVYLQFQDHPRDNERRQLADLGVELLGYMSDYAWCARGTLGEFQAALRLDFVRAVAAVDARDKLHPLVYRGATPEYARAADGQARFWFLAQPGTTPDGLARQVAGDNVLAALKISPAVASVLGPRFEVVGPVKSALRLADLDVAAYLSFVPPPFAPRGGAGPRDATSDTESNIGAVRDAGPLLSGNGVKVEVREVGKMVAHQDFQARLTYVEGDGDTLADSVNHATAVTGQIGSDGHTQPSAKGVAPGVSLLGYSLTKDTWFTDDIINGAGRGARISNHSYGPAGLTTWGDYDSVSADWDGAIGANELIVVTAGNEEQGGIYGHIDSFVGAKNTLCVTATGSAARAGDPAANPPIAQADGIASFAEFGPMNDGRVKPDLAAFGDTVTLDLGTSSTQVNSGTSFSTPVVTGVAALVFEHYKAVVGREPSAALAKALLCNSASDLGQPGPDAIYGFGMLNAKAAVATIDLRQSASLTPFIEDVTSNGNAHTYTLNLHSVPQLRVTLCWMDVPGTPAATKALVNDLDLELIAPDGSKYFPYSLDPANPSASATNTGPNRIDPIEQTVVNNPVDGAWTVRVLGTSIPQGHQAFAVCLNQPLTYTAVISASPDNGPAPLTVSFSLDAGAGQPSSFAWDFGDGTPIQQGPGLATVIYTYTAAGTYPVNLTLDNGVIAMHVIQVGKQVVTGTAVVAEKASASLKFSANLPDGDDGFQFSVLIPALKKSSADARNDLRNGYYTGMPFSINLGGTADGTTPATFAVAVSLAKNATASTKDADFKPARATSFKLNPAKGEIQVQLQHFPLQSIFGAAGMTNLTGTNGRHVFPVEVESADTIYRTVFTLNYKASSNGKTGTAKAP